MNGPLAAAYGGRRVLVTGHTGFKGAWLAAWLKELGASVSGLALEPDTEPSLFEILGLAQHLDHAVIDLRDAAAVCRRVEQVQPEFVFHLAAQSLVRPSYHQPLETFAVNVMGTAHVLEAVRRSRRPVAVVVVTSDKCYENRGDGRSFREDDPLGGHDPYSASKAAAEIVAASYRRSFFQSSGAGEPHVAMATARAGNVIGGGDWARDRIMADLAVAFSRGETLRLRRPEAVRPWQHVLDALSGYLWLGACLASGGTPPAGGAASAGAEDLERAWNFGPVEAASLTVQDLVEEAVGRWGSGSWEAAGDPGAPHEAGFLQLDCCRAVAELGWRPLWDARTAVARTVDWYRAQAGGEEMSRFTAAQIHAYHEASVAAGRAWAAGGPVVG